VYPHVYYYDERNAISLTPTLIIRNTDPDDPIGIESVRYYDSDGEPVRWYVNQPVGLAPMASMEFVVKKSRAIGGSGASFIVEWSADKKVSDPVVEAVMIGTDSARGISIVSVGRVLETSPAAHANAARAPEVAAIAVSTPDPQARSGPEH